MESDDCPARTLHRARKVQILFIPREPVKQDDSRVWASTSRQVQHCVNSLSVARELQAGADRRMSMVDRRVLGDCRGRGGCAAAYGRKRDEEKCRCNRAVSVQSSAAKVHSAVLTERAEANRRARVRNPRVVAGVQLAFLRASSIACLSVS